MVKEKLSVAASGDVTEKWKQHFHRKFKTQPRCSDGDNHWSGTMDSLGAKLSNNSLIPPRQGSNWLGRRLRTLARALRTVVGVDDGSMYIMRMAVSLFGGI